MRRKDRLSEAETEPATGTLSLPVTATGDKVPDEETPDVPETPTAQNVPVTTSSDKEQEEDFDIPETLTELNEPVSAATEKTAPDNGQPEDDELDKQILSEIMLNDYSAFIHKEYPFDLKTVEVVKKDREIKVPEPAKIPVAQEEAVEEEEETDEEPAAPLLEWNLDKRYYTIGEVSQLFKVNTSHIRFWTNEFKLRPVPRARATACTALKILPSSA